MRRVEPCYESIVSHLTVLVELLSVAIGLTTLNVGYDFSIENEHIIKWKKKKKRNNIFPKEKNYIKPMPHQII